MDLLTVDESVRLNAIMMVQFDGMLDDLLNNQLKSDMINSEVCSGLWSNL